MTVVYGLTPDGLVVKTLPVILADLDQSFQDAFGDSIDLGARSAFGQVKGILGEVFAYLWELLDAVVSSQDPDAAMGTLLEALCALTGTFRPAAAASKVTETLVGDPGTVVAAGSIISTASTSVQFTTDAVATIVALPAWAGATFYAVGDRVYSDVDRVYQCTISGVSAAGPAISGASSPITDGTVTWIYVGEHGIGAVDVGVTAASTGPTTAAAGDISVIQSFTSGLSSATNLAAAEVGRDVATDQELRTLRESELAADGGTTQDAIVTKMLKIRATNGSITSCTVFVNNTDVTDGSGVTPHSVEIMVRPTWAPGDPSDQLIYDAVLASVADGIGTVGNQSGTAVDSNGVSHVVKFSRPVEVPVYVTVALEYDATTYPSDGDTQVKNAIAAYGTSLGIGVDAVATRLGAKAFSVAGVLDVPRTGSLGGTLISVAPAPTLDTTIAIDTRHLATYAVANIIVNSVAGTP